jgi:hypothetical protein
MKAVLRAYGGRIKGVFRLYQGCIKSVLRVYTGEKGGPGADSFGEHLL